MANDLETAYPDNVGAATSEWPLGEPQNVSTPEATDGTPWEVKLLKDIVGTLHALLRSSGATASDISETALVSQFMQAIVELASGRAFNYDDSGAADAYVLDLKTGQQASHAYFDGMQVAFTPDNINTGASTINVASLGVIDIKLSGGVTDPAAGDIAGPILLTYRLLPSPHFELTVIDLSINSLSDAIYTDTSFSLGLGVDALLNADNTAFYNVAVGKGALKANVLGARNVAVGNISLDDVLGHDNVALGYAALNDYLGNENTAVGSRSAQHVKGIENTAVGFQALLGVFASSTGVSNTAVGFQAGLAITSGDNNTVVGAKAGSALTNSHDNTLIGDSAGKAITIGSHRNVAIGNWALLSVTINAMDNTAVGNAALLNLITGDENTAIGSSSLSSTTGVRNTAVGRGTGIQNNTGNDSVYIGYKAGPTVLGEYDSQLFIHNTQSDTPLIKGDFALDTLHINGTLSFNAIDASINDLSDAVLLSTSIGLGTFALDADTGTNNDNTAVGYNAGTSIIDGGVRNTAIGKDSLKTVTNADDNTAIGAESQSLATGVGNTSLGASTLNNLVAGHENTAIGKKALSQVNATSSSNIALGYEAGPVTAGLYSDELFIHNAQTDTPLIHGDMSAGNEKVTINGAFETTENATLGTWQVKSGAYTAIEADQLAVDTGAGAVTITLPAAPTAGKTIILFSDYASNWGTNNLTIARNGLNILGAAADLVISTNDAPTKLMYIDATKGWIYIP